MQIRNFIIHIAIIYTIGYFLLSLLLLLFFLVQLNNNRVFILSILFAAIMVNYATAIPLTADSSELLWGYPKKLSQNSLLLRSL